MEKEQREHEQGFIDHFLETYSSGGAPAFRIRAVIFLAITIPVMLLAAFSYVKTRNDLTEFTFLRRQSMANLTASTLRTRFDQLVDIGSSLTSSPSAETLIAKHDWKTFTEHLASVRDAVPDLESVLVADTDGEIVAASPSDLVNTVGADASGTDWFHGVSRSWLPHVSNVYRPLHDPGYQVIGVAIPLRDSDDTVQGVLLMQLRADALLSWTKDIDVGNGAFIFFTDRLGKIGIHPLIGPDSLAGGDYSAFSPVRRALNLERGVEILYDFRVGSEVMVAFEPVPRYGWTAVVEQPTRSAFSLRSEESNSVLSIYAFILLLNSLLAFFLIRTLSVVSALRQRERAIVGSIGEGLVVTDHLGIITRVNRTAARLLGMEKQVLEHSHIEDVLWVYDERGVDLLVRENRPIVRATEGNTVAGKFVFMTKTQHKFPVALTSTPLSNRERIRGAVTIFRDITKEEELDRAKKEFISVASHELLTPVSASKAFLSMLLAGDFGDPGEKQKVYLEKLFSLNQRMVELVDDLLNVSRLELGVLESAAEPVDVMEIMQSEAKQIGPLAETKRIAIVEQYVDEVPTMLLAPKLLRLVMQNLLSNAIKYTPENGSITVRLVREKDKETGTESALISVADTGIGIPKDQQAAIFSKFFRAENVREKEIAGTGLGLFIVHNIITLFKGKVWFESVPDKGTTFFVRLPIRRIK